MFSLLYFYRSSLKRLISLKGRVELRPPLVFDLKCKLLDAQCSDWSSLFFGRHCVLIGAVTWPHFSRLAKSSFNQIFASVRG